MSKLKTACSVRRIEKTLLCMALVLGVASCGGGGGAQAGTEDASSAGQSSAEAVSAPSNVVNSLPPAGQQPTDAFEVVAADSPADAGRASDRPLLISEVATSYYSNDVSWFEVHNPSSAPVRLAGYALRSSSIDLGTGTTSYAPVSFALPDVVVPAKGYLVIASKPADALHDNAQMVYVRQGTSTPFWNAHGSIELLKEGLTVDFVRFGTSTAAPQTVDEWIGVNAAALPSGPDEHGKSMVRLYAAGMPDTNRAADWALVNFATPAGRNDVAPGVIDSDLDGIPDSAKVSGGSYAGLNLYAMGARRGRRDIFIEVDYMGSTDIGTTPRREALEKMRAAFAARGIALHFDAGSLYASGVDPAQFNLGGGNAVPFAPCIQLDTLGDTNGARAGCASFQAYKNAHFDVRRRFAFHYALFAHSLNVDGSAGPSGIAEMNGNDLIITLGGYDLSAATDSGRHILINLQAATLMHEFGHNLGLRHGGNEDANYKPNHLSVMNYMYQFAGLSATPDSPDAAERYYLANALKGVSFCGLKENSPCTDAFRMDYSDGLGAALDESRLSESANIGRGSLSGAYADWDNNGQLTDAAFGRNINPLDGYGRSVLRDFDEWRNLSIAFARGYSGSSSGLSKTTRPTRADPMGIVHPHEKAEEEHLPASLRQAIRHVCMARR